MINIASRDNSECFKITPYDGGVAFCVTYRGDEEDGGRDMDCYTILDMGEVSRLKEALSGQLDDSFSFITKNEDFSVCKNTWNGGYSVTIEERFDSFWTHITDHGLLQMKQYLEELQC